MTSFHQKSPKDDRKVRIAVPERGARKSHPKDDRKARILSQQLVPRVEPNQQQKVVGKTIHITMGTRVFLGLYA